MILRKYSGFIGFAFYIISISLFIPFITSIVLGSFAIGTTEKMTVINYLILLGEIFIGRWFLHIPAIALIVSGFLLTKKYKSYIQK